MDIENDQIFNSAEADAAVDSTYVRKFFFVFKFYLLQKRCSLNVLNMILETPNFKVTNIIFESYEHRSKIILQLLNCSDMLKSTVNSPMWHKTYFKKSK
jgi:hypothetical protein